ncbi:MAG: hypothetical protein IJ731_10180 [Eubacterium sp.]|nr:hypothetical protein [Eubacterium sp.]
MKKTLSFLLSFVLVLSVFSLCPAAFAVTAQKKTMLQYTSLNLTFEKDEADKYTCSVTNNNGKYISVDASDDGNYFWLMVTSNKATGNNKPTITVYKVKDGKKTTYKKYQIVVNPVHKVKMKNIKINKGTGKRIKLINPYYDCKDYNLEYNKKIIKITQYLYDGDEAYYTLKGLKKGKTTVKAYLSGTKKLIGSFTVTVGDYKATVKKSKQNITIYYNPHISSKYLELGTFNLGETIYNYHENSVYTYTAKNAKLVGYNSIGKTEITPKSVRIFSKGTGKTTLTVYEKRGKAKKKKIGTINLSIKKAKDSAVFSSNMELDNDGIFYENFISPSESYDLKSAVVNRYINNSQTGSHFKSSEYTFTAKSNHPEIISVDKNGVCTCHQIDKDGVHKITYTVTFKDGSKVTLSGAFDTVDEDFWN